MRRGELLALEWQDVDLVRGVIIVRPEVEKTHRGREVPIGRSLRSVLDSMVQPLDRSRRVFVRADGHSHTATSLRRRHYEVRKKLPAARDIVKFCVLAEMIRRRPSLATVHP